MTETGNVALVNAFRHTWIKGTVVTVHKLGAYESVNGLERAGGFPGRANKGGI